MCICEECIYYPTSKLDVTPLVCQKDDISSKKSELDAKMDDERDDSSLNLQEMFRKKLIHIFVNKSLKTLTN